MDLNLQVDHEKILDQISDKDVAEYYGVEGLAALFKLVNKYAPALSEDEEFALWILYDYLDDRFNPRRGQKDGDK